MIKEIITYPTPTGVEYAADVRVFNDELYSFIDDLKETLEAYSLEGLSATQVGSYYNVVVVKHDGELLELINPRILKKKGEIETIEFSSYFPDVGAKMKRYESISLVYEDRNGEQHSLKADGEFAVLLQRKIDYLFGANFLTKLKDEAREQFELALNSKGVSCPTTPRKFSRDYFVKGSNYIMVLMLLLLGASFFVGDKEQLLGMWKYQLYGSFTVLGLYIVYVLYSYYENKKYSVCTNCYNMSIFGVTAIGLFRLTLLMVVSYFLLRP
jgi:peptide deformylase